MSARGQLLNVPNLLSFARLGLLPVFLVLAASESSEARIWLYILGAFGLLSDVLDGYLARRLNQMTELGKVLDPLSDKIITAALVIFAYFEKSFPGWLAALILGRDILILVLALFWRNKLDFVPVSNLLGKLAALTVALTLLAFVYDFVRIGEILTPVAFGMILLSSAVYAWRLLKQTGRVTTLKTGKV